MRDIVLVGNGTALLDRKLGSLIDSYEEVIRFNEFVTNGFEEHSGTRITGWVRHAYVEGFREAPINYVKVSPGRPLPKFAWKRPGDVYLPEFVNTYVETVLGVKTSRSMCWSTGLYALAHFSLFRPVVHIVGFGDQQGNARTHYYPDKERHHLHNFELERKFIHFLKSMNRCVEL